MWFFFFSSRRRHTRWTGDWSSDVCSSDLNRGPLAAVSNWVGMARRKEHGFSIVSAKDARPGDIVAYDWDGGADYAGASHIGIMKSRVSGGRFQAIEGNTSAGSGEGVAVRSRTTSVAPNVCFIRVGSSS